MATPQRAQSMPHPVTPLDCGIPIDSQYFDVARFGKLPGIGESALLAHFELPSQYCGVLECFSQYTDLASEEPAEVETPGLIWRILVNRQPLSPYHELRVILNPWGYGSFQFSLRLSEAAVVEMVVRRIDDQKSPLSGKSIQRIGGRLLGRYWYNSGYGGAR
jgi:hypothetical protein